MPEPLSGDAVADGRLVDAVGHDLRDRDGNASATAVRVIWTGDHLDAIRRLQGMLVEPAQQAVAQQALGCEIMGAARAQRRAPALLDAAAAPHRQRQCPRRHEHPDDHEARGC